MSDILLGAVIGGAIAAVVAWIQGHYSLKSRREDNLAQQQQQALQTQHEKDKELISRVIKVREKYLNPISSQLSKLHVSMTDFRDKLLTLIVPYLDENPEKRETREVKVDPAERNEFMQELDSVDKTLSVIDTGTARIHEASLTVTDTKLSDLLAKVRSDVSSAQGAYYEMSATFERSKAGQDFIYAFEQVLKPIQTADLSIANAAKRIESLLAGVDAGDS